MIGTPCILLIEDDKAIGTVIRVALEAEAMTVHVATSIAARNDALRAQQFDAIVTDVMLPDGNGLETLNDVRALLPSNMLPPVIVLSAQNTLDTAIAAAEEGAFEYLPKPFDLNELIRAVRSAIARPVSNATAPDISQSKHPLIGRDPAMQHVYRTIARLANSDLTVLITGESGTGKELVAQAIHQTGLRKSKAFVAINMAAIPRELIESELFGHEKGAFTGAHSRAAGTFDAANGGTLFLDEIGDMPLEAQTRLLRVLQSGEYNPIGSTRTRHTDVRIIAATNKDLPMLIEQGRFREDLYFRLNVIPLALPALRDRPSDIPILAHHFLNVSSAKGLMQGQGQKHLTNAALQRLADYSWPGNVRELQHLIQRLLLLSREQQIDVADIDAQLGVLSVASQLPTSFAGSVAQWVNAQDANASDLHAALLAEIERPLLQIVLDEAGRNQLKAAARLGINRNTLRKKIRDLGIA